MAKQPQRRPNTPPRSAPKQSARPYESRKSTSSRWFGRFTEKGEPFLYGPRNFMVMGAGLLLVILGLIAMSGGAMPDPNTWDPNLIYSPRRITLAPILMIVGFILVGVGIFLKPKEEEAQGTSKVSTP